MRYEVSGEIVMGIGRKKFKIEVDANSENHAKEKTYARFGATNRLKRGKVKIKEVKSLN